jgi:hypothetical protein
VRVDRVAVLREACLIVDHSRRDNKNALCSVERRIERFRLVEVAVPNANAARSEVVRCLEPAHAHADRVRAREPQQRGDYIRAEAAGRTGHNDLPMVVCHLCLPQRLTPSRWRRRICSAIWYDPYDLFGKSEHRGQGAVAIRQAALRPRDAVVPAR